jgi:hypothetical protein
MRADAAAATNQAAATGQSERLWVELRCPKCPAAYRERYVRLAQAWRVAQQVGRTGVVKVPLAAQGTPAGRASKSATMPPTQA